MKKSWLIFLAVLFTSPALHSQQIDLKKLLTVLNPATGRPDFIVNTSSVSLADLFSVSTRTVTGSEATDGDVLTFKQWATSGTWVAKTPTGGSGGGGGSLKSFIDSASGLSISSMNMLSAQFVRTTVGSSATFTLNPASVTLQGNLVDITTTAAGLNALWSSALSSYTALVSTGIRLSAFTTSANSTMTALSISTASLYIMISATAVATSNFWVSANSTMSALSISTASLFSNLQSTGVSLSQNWTSIFSTYTVLVTTSISLSALWTSALSTYTSLSSTGVALSNFWTAANSTMAALSLSTASERSFSAGYMSTTTSLFNTIISTIMQVRSDTSTLVTLLKSTAVSLSNLQSAVAIATSPLDQKNINGYVTIYLGGVQQGNATTINFNNNLTGSMSGSTWTLNGTAGGGGGAATAGTLFTGSGFVTFSTLAPVGATIASDGQGGSTITWTPQIFSTYTALVATAIAASNFYASANSTMASLSLSTAAIQTFVTSVFSTMSSVNDTQNSSATAFINSANSTMTALSVSTSAFKTFTLGVFSTMSAVNDTQNSSMTAFINSANSTMTAISVSTSSIFTALNSTAVTDSKFFTSANSTMAALSISTANIQTFVTSVFSTMSTVNDTQNSTVTAFINTANSTMSALSVSTSSILSALKSTATLVTIFQNAVGVDTTTLANRPATLVAYQNGTRKGDATVFDFSGSAVTSFACSGTTCTLVLTAGAGGGGGGGSTFIFTGSQNVAPSTWTIPGAVVRWDGVGFATIAVADSSFTWTASQTFFSSVTITAFVDPGSWSTSTIANLLTVDSVTVSLVVTSSGGFIGGGATVTWLNVAGNNFLTYISTADLALRNLYASDLSSRTQYLNSFSTISSLFNNIISTEMALSVSTDALKTFMLNVFSTQTTLFNSIISTEMALGVATDAIKTFNLNYQSTSTTLFNTLISSIMALGSATGSTQTIRSYLDQTNSTMMAVRTGTGTLADQLGQRTQVWADEGGTPGTNVTGVNCVGAGVGCSQSGTTVTITIAGGGGAGGGGFTFDGTVATAFSSLSILLNGAVMPVQTGATSVSSWTVGTSTLPYITVSIPAYGMRGRINQFGGSDTNGGISITTNPSATPDGDVNVSFDYFNFAPSTRQYATFSTNWSTGGSNGWEVGSTVAFQIELFISSGAGAGKQTQFALQAACFGGNPNIQTMVWGTSVPINVPNLTSNFVMYQSTWSAAIVPGGKCFGGSSIDWRLSRSAQDGADSLGGATGNYVFIKNLMIRYRKSNIAYDRLYGVGNQ